jgi:hypothetical protein
MNCNEDDSFNFEAWYRLFTTTPLTVQHSSR